MPEGYKVGDYKHIPAGKKVGDRKPASPTTRIESREMREERRAKGPTKKLTLNNT